MDIENSPGHVPVGQGDKDTPAASQSQIARDTYNVSPTHDGAMSLEDVESVDVKVRDLAVSIDTGPSYSNPGTWGELMAAKFKATPKLKSLLASVSADLKPGTLTAIIGGSGSGKTTLLNTMSERVISSRLIQGGVTTFNGNVGVHSIRYAYVMQQDVLQPTLTVRETLRYSADLRLPSSTKVEDRHRVVEDVIRELGLKECADTRIGNHQHRGCSGGEKRRVSIGVQLLANPSVLFLDEPTTGLDATSAFQLVRTLKNLAQKGRTIVTTIHQPRSEIWDLFDNLIVLAKGSPVYSGAIAHCLPWFEGHGFKLPPFVNPAEFIIDLAAVDNRTPELEQESTARVDGLKSAWSVESELRFDPLDKGLEVEPSKKLPSVRKHAPFLQQTSVLTKRTLKVTYRDPMGMAAALFEAVFMGLAAGYIVFNLSGTLSGIRSREGALYVPAALQGYTVLVFETYRLIVDVPTFDREYSETCVTPLPFLLSRRLARAITEDIPGPLIFSAIYYWLAGFDAQVDKFFIFFAVTLLVQYIAVTLAMVCVATSRNFAGASLIGNMAFTMQALCCGFFVQSNTIPIWLRWLKWLTYTFYAFGAYATNEFKDNFYDCPYEGGQSNPSCYEYDGNYVLSSLGFPPNWLWRPIVVLVAFVIFFFLLSLFEFHILKNQISIARARTSDTDLSAGKEKMSARSISEVRSIDVSLEQFSLALDKRAATGKKLPRKMILNPLSATFKAGVLNVVMGPSGSGKTSLLNAMALRLRNSTATKYRTAGKLAFNGALPSDSVIRSICSYVCQDDDALLPALTVRETLRYAAGLRLPPFMSAAEKTQRAEEVLVKMGLKDCADNLIGNEMVKGISGGEKRRVSIAIQVLTDPRVLLLDEPTSGLDAFTASSIMEVLRGLAEEGRTLILTIHQARSDLFNRFGTMLLLARGGSPVYSGSAKDMLGYFSQHSYECPRHTNPADFALDMITIDLQQDDREAETRARVQKLIEAWEDQAGKPLQAEKYPKLVEYKDPDTSVDVESVSSAKEKTVSESETETEDKSPSHRVVSHKSFNKENLSTPAELGALVRKRAGLMTALPLLLRRSSINTRRMPDQIFARLMQVIAFSVFIVLFFAPIGHGYYSVQNRMGLVQEIAGLYFVGMLQNIAIYPTERDVFYREDDDGVYGVDAFILSYTIIEAPFEVISALVFSLLTDIAIGLPRTATLYFVYCFVCFGIVSCGESLGIMFNTLVSHTGFAVNLMGACLSIATIMLGVISTDMPELYNAFNYINPVYYGCRAVAPYSLWGVEFHCSEEQTLPDGTCPVTTGQDVLDLYKFNDDPNVMLGGMAACIVIYRLVAWGLLKVVRGRWRERMEKMKGRGIRKGEESVAVGEHAQG